MNPNFPDGLLEHENEEQRPTVRRQASELVSLFQNRTSDGSFKSLGLMRLKVITDAVHSAYGAGRGCRDIVTRCRSFQPHRPCVIVKLKLLAPSRIVGSKLNEAAISISGRGSIGRNNKITTNHRRGSDPADEDCGKENNTEGRLTAASSDTGFDNPRGHVWVARRKHIPDRMVTLE